MARALLFRVLDAVDAEGFPEELRHLTIRYAYAANSRTGKAWYGQAHMAAALGISERQLRRRLALLDELAAKGRSPVRIERRRRGAPGGTGRGSDEWRIIVLTDKPKRTPTTASDSSSTGHARPLEVEPEADIHGKPKRTSTTPEEDAHVRGSSGVIQRSDPAEDLRDASRANGTGFKLEAEQPKPASKRAARRRKKPERKRADAELAAHRAVLKAYRAGVLAKTKSEPEIKPREAGAAWRLLDWAKGDEARAVAIIHEATSREYGGTTSLVAIAGDPNKYLVQRNDARLPERSRANGRRGGPVQPNSGWRPPAAQD